MGARRGTSMQTGLKKWALPALLAALGLAAYLVWSALGRAPLAPQQDYPLLGGATLSAQDLRGKVVLVNFWATSCTTCVGEMPHLVQTFNRFGKQGFELVAVAMSYDQPDYVRTFARGGPAGALPFPVAFDASGALAQAFGDVRLTPTSFLIDRSGHIVKEFVGPPDFDQLHALIGQLLSAAA
jgi:peroxiredoxin